MQLEMNNVALSTQRVLNIPVLCNSTHTIVDINVHTYVIYKYNIMAYIVQ